MILQELLKKNRSYRRFDSSQPITRSQIEQWIENSRFGASAANRQPLKYYISNTKKQNDQIFSLTAWAGYLSDWDGPQENEQPSAYLALTLDESITKTPWCDHGIAAEIILLSAVEAGFGGCILGAFNKNKMAAVFGMKSEHKPLIMIALGKPAEKSQVETLSAGASFEYYRNEDILYVPKRTIKELIQN